MGVLSLTYKRPAYVGKDELRQSRASLNDKASLRSRRSGHASGVPSELAFDNIICGTACSPMTTRDFMNYLLYVEHSAENLQFFLWYRDYIKRFHQATTSDLALAPEWTKELEDGVAVKLREETLDTKKRTRASAAAVGIFKGTDFEKKVHESIPLSNDGDPFATPPQTPAKTTWTTDDDSIFAPSTVATSVTYRAQASEAFAAAGVASPFTIQPFREEIDRIITAYIMDGAPRQLNLSDKDRKSVLHALSYTTHPSALRTAFTSVDYTLRRQSHPNFIRWAITNASPTRISFARTLGYSSIVMSFLIALLFTLSSAPRGWRLIATIGWVIGIGSAIASHRGMCICMYTMSWRRHQIRPWELFLDSEDGSQEMGKSSFDSFGSSNSFEHEPWVVRYAKRNMWRKIFEKETHIQESSVRNIHDTIFVQSMSIGLLAGGVLTAIFVPLPAGNFY